MMDRGDIYLVGLDPVKGHEQAGFRPVVVLSPGAFNKLSKTPIVAPITSGGSFSRMAGFAVMLSGTKTTGIVRCDQPRALDFSARKSTFVETAPDHVIADILARLRTLI